MEAAESEINARLWNRWKQRTCAVATPDLERILSTGESLMPEWGIDGEAVAKILAYAVALGELHADILGSWERRLGDQRHAVALTLADPDRALLSSRSSDAPLSLALAPLRQPAPAGDEALPAALLPLAQEIGTYSRKQGRAALRIGQALCSARSTCERGQGSFPEFLAHLHRHYGLSRSTCYLYMKFCDWALPDGLGSAVMKWIVQGFHRGSSDAALVIDAATNQGLTLAQLVTQYGPLRDQQTTFSTAPQAARSGSPQLIERLERSRQQLLARRSDIETQLAVVESQLRQLRSSVLAEPRDADLT